MTIRLRPIYGGGRMTIAPRIPSDTHCPRYTPSVAFLSEQLSVVRVWRSNDTSSLPTTTLRACNRPMGPASTVMLTPFASLPTSYVSESSGLSGGFIEPVHRPTGNAPPGVAAVAETP